MNPSEFEQDDRHAPTPGQLLRGITSAVATDAVLSAGAMTLLPRVHPDNVANGIGTLLLGLNMLVGYVGGRAAAKGGLSHDDSRSQWVMATIVCALSLITEPLLHRAGVALHVIKTVVVETTDVAAAPRQTILVGFLFQMVVVMLLMRFGFAMGTFAQAKREGRARDDEDETSLE